MNEDAQVEAAPGADRVALVGGQALVVRHEGDSDVLELVSAAGAVSLTVRVTGEGPVVRLEGASIQLQAKGNLSLNAGKVAIHGRESLSLTSNGDVNIDTCADMRSEARAHRITATLGNVDIRANDDVTLDGERIRMNC